MDNKDNKDDKDDNRIGMVGIIVIVAVIAAAAVGGYMLMSGDGGAPTDGTDGNDGTDNGTTDGDTDGTDNGTTDGDTDGAAEWTPYSFTDTVYYEYSVSSSSGDGHVIWDVTDVSGDEITVSIDIVVGDYDVEGEVTGKKDQINDAATNPVIATLLTSSFYADWIEYFAQGGLSEGNSWSVTYEGTTYSAEVTGTETYTGQEGYAVEVIIDGNTEFKAVVSENMGFPIYVKAGDPETSDDWIEAELVDFSS